MTSQLRKLSFTLITFLFLGAISAQTIFYEDFSNNGFDNWTLDGDGIDNWESSPTTFAEGEAPEVIMYGGPPFTGAARMISPVINTIGSTDLNVSFQHYINSGVGGYWVSLETTSDGGANWNQVWELFWDSDITLVETVYANISNADVGSDNFQFCFKFTENSALINGWVLDNITLGNGAILNNVGPNEILGLGNTINENDEVQISSLVENFGAEPASFDVKLDISDGSTTVFEDYRDFDRFASR